MLNGTEGRALKLVRLHSPAHITNLGNLTNTISETHKTQGDIKLTLVEGGNVLLFHEKSGTEALLYAANIITAEFK